MALRVLLADESSTIKKVMQLALSDFAVEVRSVPVGFDVLPVAQNFKPDIVFADVLLTKKSGYDVCIELKQNPDTARIPVVLMWSSFMDVDQAKILESRADGRLEKPFDADGLRQIVLDLVHKTKSNPISSFLSFPEMPDFEESKLESVPAIDEDVEDMFALPAEDKTTVPVTLASEEERDEGGWSHQDLTKFKLNIPEVESDDFASKFVIPQDDDGLGKNDFEVGNDFEEVSFDEAEMGRDLGPDLLKPQGAKITPQPAASARPQSLNEAVVEKVGKTVKDQMMESLKKGPSAAAAQPNSYSQDDINPEMVEKIVREEARKVIETVCWKVLPEIAERLVKEELNKILRNIEKSV